MTPSSLRPRIPPSWAVVPADFVPDRSGAVSFLSNQSRVGEWILPRLFRAVSVMGNITIDLTRARIGAGTSHIDVRSIFANIEILVPLGLRIECEGSAFAGNFEAATHLGGSDVAGGALVRITGVAFMGNVEVKVVDPNEPTWFEKLSSKFSDHVSVVAMLAGLALSAVGCRASLPFDEPNPPASQDIETTLFLIGDAGEPDPRAIGAPLESLTVQASAAPQRSVIVFLGDNVYPGGIPEEGRAEWADARRRLDAQVRAVPAGVRGIFVPGNHDWAHEEPFGLYSVRLQERLIASIARAAGRDVRMLPGNGCPGPVSIDIGRLRFIALDTQWWLHDYIVRDSATNCINTIAEVTDELRRQVKAPGERRVVVVGAHHPMMTGGVHGGWCGITGPFRRFAGRSQDIMSTKNIRMRDSLESAFRAAPPLVHAAGHDHSLQVLRGGTSSQFLLVSGAGSASKASCAVRMRESYYASPHRAGFMRLDILKDKGVLLRVYRYTGAGSGGLAYSQWLEPRL